MKKSYFRKLQKCWYTDNGFCRFGQQCKKIHFKAICFIRNSELNKIKDAKKQQKFYCDDCLFRSSSQNEFNEHVNNRHNKDHK